MSNFHKPLNNKELNTKNRKITWSLGHSEDYIQVLLIPGASVSEVVIYYTFHVLRKPFKAQKIPNLSSPSCFWLYSRLFLQRY